MRDLTRHQAVARYNARVASVCAPWRAEGASVQECCRRLAAVPEFAKTWHGRPWSRRWLAYLLRRREACP